MDWDDFIYYFNEKYKVGEQLYNTLRTKRPSDTDIIISPMQLGDTVWLSAYAEAYRQKNNCRLLYVVKKSQERIPHMYEAVDMVLGIEPVEMEALSLFIVRNKLWNSNHILYANHHGNVIVGADGYAISMNIDEYENIEAERCSLLGLDEVALPSMMKKTPNLYDEAMAKKFANSVMLMPSANSCKAIDISFWTKLAEYIKEDKGYKVFTNYNGLDCEMMISGTEPVSSTFDELCEMSKYIDMFIGLRSGICDYLAACGARLAVIYSQDWIFTGDRYKFWLSPHNLGTGLVKDFAYESEKETEIISELGALIK
jgi:hypothetical protein